MCGGSSIGLNKKLLHISEGAHVYMRTCVVCIHWIKVKYIYVDGKKACSKIESNNNKNRDKFVGWAMWILTPFCYACIARDLFMIKYVCVLCMGTKKNVMHSSHANCCGYFCPNNLLFISLQFILFFSSHP